ncbi:MAG TPA: hypothetical protein VNL14_11030 [Candidatus Acidoferrales bacterium]|nr:hypothetical protein [Candidatus Acidoferrales bacterium]
MIVADHRIAARADAGALGVAVLTSATVLRAAGGVLLGRVPMKRQFLRALGALFAVALR